jgi:hypothetical protein
VDHQNNGLTGRHCQFPKAHGVSFGRHKNSIVYIADLLVHTDTHKAHLEAMDKVLHQVVNQPREMGFWQQRNFPTLCSVFCWEGSKQEKNKLKVIEDAKLPTEI